VDGRGSKHHFFFLFFLSFFDFFDFLAMGRPPFVDVGPPAGFARRWVSATRGPPLHRAAES